jgi:hypothetical protein
VPSPDEFPDAPTGPAAGTPFVATANHPDTGDPMPRIIVTTDPVSSELTDASPVLLDEHVHSVHLSTDHAAAQLIERLAWAVGDAENAERARSERRAWQQRSTRSRGPAKHSRAQHAISA